MMLTEQELSKLRTEGCLLVKGVVPRDNCERLLRACRREVFGVIAPAVKKDLLEDGKMFRGYMAVKKPDGTFGPGGPISKKGDEHLSWKDLANNSMLQDVFAAGNSAPCWEVRELVAPVFEEIYGTSDLRTSVDNMLYEPPKQKLVSADPSKGTARWHVDHMGAEKEGVDHRHYQGLLSLSDTDWRTELAPGTLGVDSKGKRFYQLKAGEIKKITGAWAPTMEAGDLLLWDSRKPHRALPGTTERCVVPVSMSPGSWSTPQEDEKRWERLLFYMFGYSTNVCQ